MIADAAPLGTGRADGAGSTIGQRVVTIEAVKSKLALLLLCGVALVALFFALRRTSTTPADRAPRPAIPDTAGDLESNDLESAALAAASAAPEREAAVDAGRGSPALPAASGVRIAGSLREPNGTRVLGDRIEIELTRSEGKLTRWLDAAGNFEFGPLAPEHVTLAVRSPTHQPARVELDLTLDEPKVVREIVLVPLADILVRVRTPEGQPLSREMMSSRVFNYTFRLCARATREPPVAGADGVLRASGEALGDYGGIGYAASGWRDAVVPDDAIGRLRFDGSPAFVSLMFEDTVLGTIAFAGGEKEMVFIVSTEQVASATSGVKLRVIDARTHLPLREAVVWISSLAGAGSTIAGEDGVVDRRGLSGTEARVRVQCTGHAEWSREVNLHPGRVRDLRDVSLETSVTVRGKVLDVAGMPTNHELEFIPVEPRHGELPQRFHADARTGFVASDIGPRRYLVRSTVAALDADGEFVNDDGVGSTRGNGDSGQLPGLVVDFSRGNAEPLELHLEPAGRLDVEAEPSSVPTLKLSIETAAGLPVWRGTLPQRTSRSFQLARGNYRVSWRRAGDRRIPLDVTIGVEPTKLRL